MDIYYMKWVINSYHGNIDWIKEYTDDVVYYDKKDKNCGSNIHDYMSYIVDNYDNLPDRVLFGKTNMLQRHLNKEEFDILLQKDGLVPLMTQTHKVYDPVCHYDKDGMYCEKNDSWYLHIYPTVHYDQYYKFAEAFDLPNPKYLAFAPGACWIVPRENILKRSRDYYTRLRDIVEHDSNPGEAHMIERALFYIWS